MFAAKVENLGCSDSHLEFEAALVVLHCYWYWYWYLRSMGKQEDTDQKPNKTISLKMLI